jgi:hypothetical protein
MKKFENGKETHQVLVGDISREWRYNHYQTKMASKVPYAWIGRAIPIPWPLRRHLLTLVFLP